MIRRKLNSLLISIIRIIAFAGIAFLMILCIHGSTVIRADSTEHTIYYRYSRVFVGAVAIAVLAVAFLFKRRMISWEICLSEHMPLFRKLRIILFGILLLEGAVWIWATSFIPNADQKLCLNISRNLIYGSTADFGTGSYGSTYRNQYGLILIECLLGSLFGPGNATSVQILNVICLPCIFLTLSLIGEKTGIGKIGQLLIQFSGIFCFPAIFYTAFAYGTILGLTLSLFAILSLIRFTQTGRKRHLILCFLQILVSCIAKQNYLIFLIALIIYVSMLLIRTGDRKLFPTVFLLIAVIPLQLVIPSLALKTIYQAEPESPGFSSLSYVAMGLQEGDKAPGWYNGLVSKLQYEADYDADMEKQLAIDSIRSSIADFSVNSAEVLDFFIRKEASMWCDPSFGAMYYTAQSLNSAHELPDWVATVRSFEVEILLSDFLKPFQLIIWLGCLLALLSLKGREPEWTDLLLLCFVGVFLFHTFWEAKSQYTWPVFLLMFPPAVWGFQKTLELTGSVIRETVTERTLQTGRIFAAFSVPVLIILSFLCPAFDCLVKDTDYVKQSLSWIGAIRVSLGKGEYIIRAVSSSDSYLSMDESGKLTVSDTPCVFHLIPYGGLYSIRSEDDMMYLAADNGLVLIKCNTEAIDQPSWNLSKDGTAYSIGSDYWGNLMFDLQAGEAALLPDFQGSDGIVKRWEIILADDP